MGVFHVFRIVQMVPNRAKRSHIYIVFKRLFNDLHLLSYIILDRLRPAPLIENRK